MRQLRAKIISNIKISANYHKLIFKENRIANIIQPAQFLMLKVANSSQVLLRRPFSVHRTRGKNIEILYEVIGKGTQALANKRAGEYLDIIGPLGNGFSTLDSRSSIIVAGGMGVAPLLFLAEKTRIEYPESSIQVLIGANTKNVLLCTKEFKKLGCEVKVSTDDGSKGFKGKVTDLLKDLLATRPVRKSPISNGARYSLLATIYACGPRLMLKEVCNISKKYSIPAQISLEEHMACGIGACLGCVVKTRTEKHLPAGRQGGQKTEFEYKRVCKEGPVFNAKEIIW